MSTTKTSALMSAPLIDSVPTNADFPAPALHSDSPGNSNRSAWQHLIDHQLIEWGRDTDQFDDEGIEPPSREIVQLAISWAERFRDANSPTPNSVVLDANGGIVFERREADETEVIHVWDDGTTEYQRFHGTHLVRRWPL